jgi:hypothetical protein
MIELKVQCDCGQRFKFDVEPMSGQMPFNVACPICGRDGTNQANQLLAQSAAPPRAGAPFVARVVGSSRPAAAAAPAPVGMLLEEPAAGASTAIAPPPPPPALPVSRPHHARLAQADSGAAPAPKPSFGLGLLGAAAGTLVGSLVYFALFNYTGFQFKLIAVGVGYLSGMGAEWLGRKEGSKELGMLAATFALIGIVAAQYFTARNWWMSETQEDTESYYEESVAEARRVVAAIPNGTDQEIRLFLAKEDTEPGEKPDVSSITAEEVRDFQEQELPGMRQLAGGKITKEQFEKQLKNEIAADGAGDEDTSDEDTFKAVFLLLLLSKFNLFSMAAAAGLAFKLCANA